MKKEDLIELKQRLSQLSDEELKKRNLYLQGLANGTIQGPPVGYPSIDKTWLKHYPKDAITTDVAKVKAYDLILNNNKDHMNDVALMYLGKKITYKEFFLNVDLTVRAFREKGVKKGDIVTMAMATTPEMIYVVYALNRIGAVSNAIDPRLTADEFKSKIVDSNSKYFIGLDMCVDQIEKIDDLSLNSVIEVSPVNSAPKPIKVLANLGTKKKKRKEAISWTKFIDEGKKYNGLLDEKYEENEAVIILYTGGTTGKPKGVILTNENLNTMATTQVISDFNLERGDTFLNFLPPFSAYSIVNAVHDPLYLGFQTILVPKFEPKDFPKLMAKFKPNHVLSGPILWDYMMNDKKYKNTDLSNLKSPISGGDSMSAEFEKKLNEYLKKQGCKYKVQQGYGMTEVSAAACYSTDNSYAEGSVGVPYPKNTVSVFNNDTNEELGFNQEGAIRISTPTMMKGYNNNQTATDEIINTDVDGKRWITTGDIGRIDENGNVFISGRLKRMIVRSGNKIFPLNIENLILSIPEVDKCSIVGMPDKDERYVPVAYIVLTEDAIGNEEAIIQKVEKKIKENMPDFAIPTKFIFRNDLPLTDMSKIDFKELEQESLDYVDNNSKIIKKNMVAIKKKN